MKENQVYRDLGKDVIAAQNNDRDAQERIIVCVRDMIYYADPGLDALRRAYGQQLMRSSAA